MATDTSTPSGSLERDSTSDSHSDDFFRADQQDSVFVQVAQADGVAAPAGVSGAPQQVAIPAGTDVVRIAVQPGEVLELGAPFTGGAEVIGRIGDGNLAIKVGEVTVILQGYVDANQQAPVTIETADGQPIDVATMLASTDPAIDIQTAAGPGDAAAGAQGADNNGALFSQFGPGGGLGGFAGVGAQDQTELSYGVIDNSIRNDFADPVLGTLGGFAFSVGPLSGGHSERFFRDPAQVGDLGSFDNFLYQYQLAVEGENPLYPGPGWADFKGTGATDGDFAEYLDQTRRTVDVAATFTGAAGDLLLNGITPGLTSNGSPLHADSADGGHTLFVRRDSDGALVAVIHVEPTDTGFTIETIMVNRLDHPDHGTGDAGRDELIIGVDFTVYDGPLQEGEGNDFTSPPSQDGSAAFTFADDVPLLDNTTYHNLDGAMVGDTLPKTDSTEAGLVDEDWLQGGANDKGANGASNADANGDTHGGSYVNGQINVDFGADGPSQSDNPGYEDKGKHAFALDTSPYTQGEVFHYGDGTLSSGGQTLYVLLVSENQLVVGIPAPEPEDDVEALIGGDTWIFSLTLNQDTGAFTFSLHGPLDHFSDLFPGAAENTIPLAFDVIATDDDGDTVGATIDIDVNDDVPIARNDSDQVAAGSHDPETGNVITGAGTESPATGFDIQGADNARVTGVAAGNLGADQDGQVGTEIQGSYGKLTLNENGGYTYTRGPGTPGDVDDVFTYTITDKDGDTSTATLTIKIGDAPPSVSDLTPSLRGGDVTVDEDDLPARPAEEPAGSDGTDSTTQGGDFTINAPDGVKDLTIGGNPVITNGVFAATSFTTPFGNTLEVTAYDPDTGKISYTYTLNDNTNHPDGNGENSVSEDLQVVLTDQDGDSVNDVLSATIVDDVPSAFDPQDQSLLNAAGGIITGGLDIAGHTGADGMSAIVFSGGSDGDKATLADGTTPVTSGGKDVLLSGFGTDTLTGYVDANKNDQVDAGEEVFTVKLDGQGDQYAFTLIKAIDDGSHLAVASDFSDIHAGKQDWYGVGANAGTADSKDLLYTPLNPSTQDVNTSAKDLGSGDQWLDGGEGLRIDFVTGLTGDFDTNNGFDFAHHYQVTDFQFTIMQVGGKDTTSVRLTAADVTKDNNVAGTTEAEFLAQTLVAITAGEVLVLRGVNDVTDTLTIDYQGDGTVIIHGLEEGDVIQVHDADGFDRLSIDSVGDKQFSIGDSKVLDTVGGCDLDMKFETTLTDNDGDTSSGQYIGINLQTDDGESHTFKDGPGDDMINGGKGSDLIFGDAGNDTLLYDSRDTFTGGDGFDRVLVTGGGHAVTFDSGKFIGIEMIDLGAADDRSGAVNQNSLALSASDVVAANGSAVAGAIGGHQINFFVIGDTSGPTANDKDDVHLTNFSKIDSGAFVDPATGVSHDYDIYQSSIGPVVKVAIEQGLDVT
jgi:T1SS-143 domain-containing protein